MMSLVAWSLPIGALLDAVVGDPRGWPHPVRAIGWLISRGERLFRRIFPAQPFPERVAGLFLTALVVSITALSAWTLVAICDQLGGLFPLIGRSLLISSGLAARSLADETRLASEAPDLTTARRELSMIVGRDTDALDWPDIRMACIETVGENTSDGVIAPLFWYALLGPAGLWGYKAINTLDSMVGHKDAHYRNFGWASARLDDLAGLIPARLTWLLFSISAFLTRERAVNAFVIGWRDGRKHESPNAAWGEASIAGALGIRVGGEVTYDGVSKLRPFLGDPLEPIGPTTVRRSLKLMRLATLIAVILTWALRLGVLGLDS